jgi:L-histidine N-alpha-methyltransferase
VIAIEVHLDADTAATMRRDVLVGLSADPKELAPKYFYDDRGSQLFEQITDLPEYYPTRAERAILVERADEIIAAAGAPRTLVELGSGSAAKIRVSLSAVSSATSSTTWSGFRTGVAVGSSPSSAARSATSTPTRAATSSSGSQR